MPKPKPPSILVSLTPNMSKYLDAFLHTGLYGVTREEVAERLLAGAIVDKLPTMLTDAIVAIAAKSEKEK